MVGTTNARGLHPSPCVQSLQLFLFPPRMGSQRGDSSCIYLPAPLGWEQPLTSECELQFLPEPPSPPRLWMLFLFSYDGVRGRTELPSASWVSDAGGWGSGEHLSPPEAGLLGPKAQSGVGWGAVWLQHTTGVSLGCGFWLYPGDIQATNIEFVLPSQLWGSPRKT